MSKISFSNDAFGDDQMSLFSFFGDEEKKTPETAASSETGAVDTASEDEDEADVEVEETADEKPRKAVAKKSTKKKSVKKLTCPVTLVGTGWTWVYQGTAGDEVTPTEVIKTAFLNGYTCVLNSRFKSEDSTIFVESINQMSSSDDNALPSVDISLGNLHVKYTKDDFPGMDDEEISVFDMTEKFISAQPDFAGCALKTTGAYATPVFDTKYTINDGESIKVWTDSGIKEYTDSEAKALFADSELYISETGVVFELPKSKKAATLVVPVGDIAEVNDKSSKAVEKYTLPFTLILFGMKKPCTSETFGGKDKVTKDDIIELLKPEFRVFRSRNRKADIIYERSKNLVSVAVVSGEKGAVFSECMNAPERVEETVVGTFKGTYTDNLEDIKSLSFKLNLPKISYSLLDEIIAYFKKDLTKEAMAQIYWSEERGYYIVYPEMYSASKTFVKYVMPALSDTLVITIHSHNSMPAVFSRTDDEDEIYTGLFGVIGRLNRNTIEMSFRAGMEGCFAPVLSCDLFEEVA